MGGCLITIVLFCLTTSVIGQFEFMSLRYNENYSFLKNDTLNNWYKIMKFKKLGNSEDFFISSGGEVRYQFQHFTNEDWGNTPVKSYNSYYTRFLFHSDLHISKGIRMFVQLNSTYAIGRVTSIRMIDQNELDLHQAFLDWKPIENITFRIGRQEFLYGSQRIISVREGPNNRQSFDAVKLVYKESNTQFDGFYAKPVRIQLGQFNDALNNLEQIWSFYVSNLSGKYYHNMDVYYLGFQSDSKTYDAGENDELRHSFGVRVWKKSESFSYDFEALYQFGSWGDYNIEAYTASIDASYFMNTGRKKTQLGLKTEFISGDKNRNDNSLNSFNPLYPRGAYFGLAALIGPVNLVDFHPSWTLGISPRIKLSLDYDAFWRYSINDGIYGPNVLLTFDSESAERFIGNQFGCAIEWQPNSFIAINPELMYFLAGPYIKDVSSGQDVFFGALTIQLKY
jgi:hypothetical protein